MELSKLLGRGAYANVYLSIKGGREVAVKKPNDECSKSKSIKYALQEVKILQNFPNSQYLLNIIDFCVDVNNNYIITELLGNKLSSFIKYNDTHGKKIPILVVKNLCKQILYGLDELAKLDIFHNDLKPENILFTMPFQHCLSRDLQVKITDFGGSFTRQLAYDEKSDFEHSRPTRYYISPERLVKAPVWIAADMWSFGCIAYELLTLETLFNPYRDNNMGINSAHIMLIMECFGSFPISLIESGKRSNRYFIRDIDTGNFIHRFQYLMRKRTSLQHLLEYNDLLDDHIPGILGFLIPILEFEPSKRITPTKCLKSTWLK